MQILASIQILLFTWKGKIFELSWSSWGEKQSCAMTVQAYGHNTAERRGGVLRKCFKLLFPDILNYTLLSPLWNSHCLHSHFCLETLFRQSGFSGHLPHRTDRAAKEMQSLEY